MNTPTYKPKVCLLCLIDISTRKTNTLFCFDCKSLREDKPDVHEIFRKLREENKKLSEMLEVYQVGETK